MTSKLVEIIEAGAAALRDQALDVACEGLRIKSQPGSLGTAPHVSVLFQLLLILQIVLDRNGQGKLPDIV